MEKPQRMKNILDIKRKENVEDKFQTMRKHIDDLQNSIWSKVSADDIAYRVVRNYVPPMSSKSDSDNEYVSECESFTNISSVSTDIPRTKEIQLRLQSMRKLLKELHT